MNRITPQSLGASFLDAALLNSNANNRYPPYDITKYGDDEYELVMALAGFRKDDVKITVLDSKLTITGVWPERKNETKCSIIASNIAKRSFRSEFKLGPYVRLNTASMINGMLTISLIKDVPKDKKEQVITIF